MQILRHLYQVGGDMNGITWDGVDAGFNDGNTYFDMKANASSLAAMSSEPCCRAILAGADRLILISSAT